MKNKILILGALLLTLAAASCREDADVLQTYAYDDVLAFDQANKSYAGKFRVFWNAMNQNYTLWDYEEQNGLDWDAVYDEYLPKFEALDQKDTVVTDSMLNELLVDLVTPLHDGHLYVEFNNHQTGHAVGVSPGRIRNGKRQDVEELKGFQATMAGYSINGELKRFLSYDATVLGQLRPIFNTPGAGYMWVKTRLSELLDKSELTEGEVRLYEGLRSLENKLDPLVKKPVNAQWLTTYNAIVSEFAYLNVPFLEQVDPRLFDYGLRLQFAQTTDDIVYLQISSFFLTAYLNDASFADALGGSVRNNEIRQHVVQAWQAWFDTIQELHKSGRLKGVIIDVRSNSGGFMNDSRYLLGALLPSGGLQYGWSRYKRGVGRYDLSPFTPKTIFTMDDSHEIIDDKPIVVLANAQSVSMSEMTSLSVKQLKNGTVIGRRTFGGLCGLTSNTYNTYNYSGHAGVRNVTPVWVYIPTECIFDMDKKPLDGIGVTPDIEVAYDAALFRDTGKDTQIDRALEYIRTGK